MESTSDTALAQPLPPRRSMRLRKKRIRHFDLSVLSPVRSVLHLLLTDDDAARLLRVSRATATHLLAGYIFTRTVFQPHSVKAMWRLKALYETYDMKPTRMTLPEDVEELMLEEGSGRSPFPSSLTWLRLIPPAPRDSQAVPSTIIIPKAPTVTAGDTIDCLWTHPSVESEDERYGELLMESEMKPVRTYRPVHGHFIYPLPPGLLPHGLRRLLFPTQLKSTLQVGSIPSTIEVLQLSYSYTLSEGLLPSSLVHLVLSGFNLPLSPRVLPPSLQRLLLSRWNHPLAVNVLPASLKALELHSFDQPLHPQVLPSGLTHLRLNEFNQPLSVGSLPPSLVSLDLGSHFNHPLLPNVLPFSLRVFFYSRTAYDPLIPGALPEGLVVLHWCWKTSPQAAGQPL